MRPIRQVSHVEGRRLHRIAKVDHDAIKGKGRWEIGIQTAGLHELCSDQGAWQLQLPLPDLLIRNPAPGIGVRHQHYLLRCAFLSDLRQRIFQRGGAGGGRVHVELRRKGGMRKVSPNRYHFVARCSKKWLDEERPIQPWINFHAAQRGVSTGAPSEGIVKQIDQVMSTLALEELIAGPRPHNIRNVNSGFIDPQVTHLGGTTGAFATPKTPESLSLRQGGLET
mmetsp:Transcript_11555/g.24007  ORF Transcript_11555/g.24007 Transcript_11555/m.24007 type:complete len:224 (+) Transcript_11555:462-1133(+)